MPGSALYTVTLFYYFFWPVISIHVTQDFADTGPYFDYSVHIHFWLEIFP